MKRCFISRISECPGMCEYCFGKWDSYLKFSSPEKLGGDTVVYPNCDGDMFDSHFDEMIQYVSALSDSNISVSISTKFNIDDNCLFKLKELHDHLYKKQKGIVKLSVSFSCEQSIPILEKNTASYLERLELAKRICDLKIPYVTIIKPILPFIELEEYFKIIGDMIHYKPYFLLGDLYVSSNTLFYKKYIEGKYPVKTKKVSWNGNNGYWDVVESSEKKAIITQYIKSLGGMVFESDIDVIEYLKIQ